MKPSISPTFSGAVAIALLLAPVAFAQCAAPTWIAENQIPGVNGDAYAVTTWDPDGAGPLPPAVVVGGAFAAAGSVLANEVAMWDGTAWQPLGAGFNGVVKALTVFNGTLIAGGLFQWTGPTSSTYVPYVARWNGSSWQQMGLELQSYVRAFGVFNGTLVASSNHLVSGVQQWTGTAWAPLGTGGPVATSLTEFNGSLIATRTNGVDRWNGTSWQTITPGPTTGPTGTAFFDASAVYGGQLVAAGYFTQVDGVAASSVASWNGTNWSPVGGGMSGPGGVNVLTVYNGDLIAGGGFTSLTGVASSTYPGVARWNGASWSLVGTAFGSTIVLALTVWNSELVAAGSFQHVGTLAAARVAHWNGSAWNTFGYGLNGPVNAITQLGSDLVLAGQFTAPGSGNAPKSDVVLWNGSTYQALGTGMNSAVNALAIFNGEVIAAGDFTTAGGVAANRIARWTGTAWAPLGLGMNHMVERLAIYNGELVAAGQFTVAGAVLVNYVARWNGSVWQSLGIGTDGSVMDLAQYNGELIAGGSFIGAGGVISNGIARWNGSIWQPLGSGVAVAPGTAPSPIPPSAKVLAVYGGELIAGGGFGMAGGVPVNGIARWNGLVWQPLGGGVGPGGVMAMTTFAGDLIVAGISTINRWNGSSWQPFTSVGGLVKTFATWGGALIMGGGSFIVGGVGSPYLARWSSPQAFLALSQPSGPGTSVQVLNHWLIPGHEYFNLASINPCAGGPGTGPYGGLCFNNVADLIGQLTLPVGAAPFHFVAGSPDASFGPFVLPPGLSIETLSVDVTGGVLGCISPASSYVVN